MAEDEGWWEPMRQTMLREQTERAARAEAELAEAKHALERLAAVNARSTLERDMQSVAASTLAGLQPGEAPDS